VVADPDRFGGYWGDLVFHAASAGVSSAEETAPPELLTVQISPVDH
jgi:hypothetical protein